MRWILVVALIGGCSYYIEEGDEPADDMSGDPADDLFESEVLPMLDSRCGACHAGDRAFIDFLAPRPPDFETARERLLGWPALVDIENPGQSRLLTKGLHEGQTFGAAEIDLILRWIELEATRP